MSKINLSKMEEAGYWPAMTGLSLNKNQPLENMPSVAVRLKDKTGGHNKFLEFIYVWIEVTAPRYAWQDLDTYRVGTSKQSESTNHTIMKGILTTENFEDEDISLDYLFYLNEFIRKKEFLKLKRNLPEGFLQRRIWCLNYSTMRNIILKRWKHKLPVLREFAKFLYDCAEHKELLPNPWKK